MNKFILKIIGLIKPKVDAQEDSKIKPIKNEALWKSQNPYAYYYYHQGEDKDE